MATAPDPQALLAQAEDLVRVALAKGAQAAEAFVVSGSMVSVDIERDRVTYTTGGSDSGTGLRVVRDGRLGFAYASEPHRVTEAAERALALSRLAPRHDFAFPMDDTPYQTMEGLFDPGIVTMDSSEAVEMAGEVVDAAKAVHPDATVVGGGTAFGWGAAAVASSEGMAVASAGTSASASASVVLHDASTSTGFEHSTGRMRSDVDAAWAGREAARIAVDAQGAVPLEAGGEMELVLRPSAMAELVEFTVAPSIIGDAAQRGESAWTGRTGERVAAKGFTLVDDPTLPGGFNSSRSDDEGVASRRNVLVDDGVLRGFLYDSFSAHEYKVRSTGSAVRGPEGGGWRSQPQAFPTNLVIEAPSKGDVDDLVAEVDRGLLVQEVMGAHTANVSTLDFSVGSTMPVEIRRGERVGVREPVMVAGNVGDLLANLVGAGGVPRMCPGVFSSACVVVPWLAAGGVVVTV